jgi:hypothetical protein
VASMLLWFSELVGDEFPIILLFLRHPAGSSTVDADRLDLTQNLLSLSNDDGDPGLAKYLSWSLCAYSRLQKMRWVRILGCSC